MAETPDDTAYINAGAQLLGQGANIAAAASADRRGRRWAEQQYGKQRADALADWEMQNQYNSPAAQYARLKASNINPRLMYGNSSNMPASATMRSSDPGSYRPVVPNIDATGFTNSLLVGYDLRAKQAQTDNLKEQLNVLKAEALLKSQTTASLAVNTARNQFDLDLAQKLQTNTIEQATANLQKTYADTAFTLDANERAAAMQGYNIRTATENVLNLRASRAKTDAERNQINQAIKNLKTDNQIKEQDLKLKQKGIQPHDSAFTRAVQDAVNKYLPTPEKVAENVKGVFKRYVERYSDPKNKPYK